jgi:hypothetical protein
MNISFHDFVTVDMRGLKAALVARAEAQRVSVSVLVRGAVARDLGLALGAEPSRAAAPTRPSAWLLARAQRAFRAVPIWRASLPMCQC